MAYWKRTEEVAQLIRDIESVPFIKGRIRNCEENISILYYKMSGMSKSGVRLTQEQMLSNLPMPTYRGSNKGYSLDLLEKIEKEKSRLDYWKWRLKEIDVINELEDTDLKMINALYVEGKKLDDVAIEFGYSNKQLTSHINMALTKVLEKKR